MMRPFVLITQFQLHDRWESSVCYFCRKYHAVFSSIFLVLLVCIGLHLALFSPQPPVLVWCSFLSSVFL